METVARRLPDTDNTGIVQAPSPVTHFAKTASLVAASIAFLPLSSSILAFSYTCSTAFPQNGLRREIRSSPRFQPKTILVTGVGTAKGLRIARAFYETGHKVIGADFEPLGVPSSGRFSRALSSFHHLRMPNASSGATLYMRDLIRIIEEEDVQLWLSCSGIVSSVDDGEARELVEHRTRCSTFQVDFETASKISDSDEFASYSRSIGLPAPEVHAVQSRAAVHQILGEANGRKQYVMKPVGKNTSSGANPITTLPRRTLSQTYQHISSIKVSKDEPWILKQHVTGEEYNTCSIIIDGEVKAFVVCHAAKVSLHHQALPTDSGVGKVMLNFTHTFAAKAGSSYTGHLSFTFLVEEKATESGIEHNILPVACNPQANTAMVLFARTKGSVDLVRAYMNALILPADGINGDSGLTHPNYSPSDISFPHLGVPGVYFSGQDLVSLVLFPLLQLLTFKAGFMQFVKHCFTFLDHLIFWQEGTYELWDPLPWFWLYHVTVPVQLLSCIWTGRNWKHVDVSTSEVLYD